MEGPIPGLTRIGIWLRGDTGEAVGVAMAAQETQAGLRRAASGLLASVILRRATAEEAIRLPALLEASILHPTGEAWIVRCPLQVGAAGVRKPGICLEQRASLPMQRRPLIVGYGLNRR
jgi:hypothetical protein